MAKKKDQFQTGLGVYLVMITFLNTFCNVGTNTREGPYSKTVSMVIV